ncbi:MAG: hypothetical protein ACLF0G_10770 [Candidatus Brocadiia bacterium]
MRRRTTSLAQRVGGALATFLALALLACLVPLDLACEWPGRRARKRLGNALRCS